ncbi:tRNA modification GTPase MnmE [Rubripirellula amarantea]|uniref:tRNA modification GTPase MnmE n=1 Tax=Rubripirellula amarantea TaxID=2527999 RepID=A0A5C5WK25_9BACT|nr:tRNA modification GTPase [Rubripirellula amarantea]TWT50361.1 tRNA modification GTPase MnmE [Rubripirellula amarantea]
MRFDETIVAIASPTSPAPRGVVRLSGSDAMDVLETLGVPACQTKAPRRLRCCLNLSEPIGSIDVDILRWPTSRSYTGQPSAEIHTFGSLPILSGIVDSAIKAGARAARPGEFTMRAFLAGQLDLTQAEAVLGVIEAEQPGSLDHALRQLSGNLSQPLGQLRSELLNLLADVEAGLDFVDEDIEFVSDKTLLARLTDIAAIVAETIEQIRSRGGTSSATTIALCGDPNAGKSRLLNVLAGQEIAIVADLAGTTRDFVSANAHIGLHAVMLQDTAGLEKPRVETPSDGLNHEISDLAQQQTARVIREAGFRLWCVDGSRDDFDTAADQVRELASSSAKPGVIDLFLATKGDLVDKDREGWILCSSATGKGIENLKDQISNAIAARDAEQSGSIIGTAARCSETLLRAKEAINDAITQVRQQSGHEFVSSDLRLAAQCIGEVTGEVYNEDILDRVFSRFCIGK